MRTLHPTSRLAACLAGLLFVALAHAEAAAAEPRAEPRDEPGAEARPESPAERLPERLPGQERLVVVSNGEVVGHLVAQRGDAANGMTDGAADGVVVAVDYYVDNNGRGPKIKEKIRLDDRGYPLEWTIAGTSAFGGTIDEAYRWRDGSARWHSQADHGEVAVDIPPMYIEADGSPWSLGMYARALLADPDHAIDVLPSGSLKLAEVGRLAVGEDGPAVTIYELSGIGLDPELIALDADRRLFASVGGRGGLIREGFADRLPALQDWAREYEGERLEDLQRRLAHRWDAPIRFVDVRVFDSVAMETGEPVSVLVSGGRIASIDDTPPQPGEVVVDGQGGTLVPGLWDMHAHNGMDSGLFWLAAGVTSTRDMGNDIELLAEVRSAVESGRLAGPRITPAGLIEARSPFSARIGIVAEDLDGALEAVRWYAEHDYHAIKTYNSMNPEWVPALVAEARRLGLGVTGHVPAFMHPDQVIEAGYDSIAHINQLMLGWLLEPGEDTRTALRLTAMKRGADLDLGSDRVQRTVGLMREHGTALDTTAVILERLMLSRAGEVQPGDAPYLSHMPIGYQRYRKRTFVPLEEPGDDAAYRAGFAKILQVIELLHDNNIPLLVGTDDATGFTVHRELELYEKAGIPAAEVLSIATLGSARYLGQQDLLGSIEPGKLADFLLVAEDPAEDIRNIRGVRAVSRGGVLYFPAEIYEALGIVPFAAKAPVSVPEEVTEPPATGLFAPTLVDAAPPAPLVRTRHSAEFGGERVEYEVVTGEYLLVDAEGEPAATMFSTSYVRTGQTGETSATERPVLFLFNGGPGASSSPLHLGVGPVRRPPDDPDGALVTFPGSPLDATDMVFVDPVGTGYSRLFREDAGPAYWGIEQDADAVLLFIGDWLRREGREASPVFVMGESYGGIRAISLLARAGEVQFAGALLLSPAIDMTAGTPVVGNNLPYIFRLPAMAATAVYHDVVEAGGRSGTAVFEDAAAFAQADYAAALYQGNALPAEQQRALSEELAKRTGLPASYWLEQNLRVSAREFSDKLLEDEGLRVGRLDARAKGPLEEYQDNRPPTDDPGFGGGRGGRPTGELLDEYFEERLATDIDRPYRTLNLHANTLWDFGHQSGRPMYFSVAPDLQEAMRDEPALRVWVGGGIYDLVTPVMAARYILGQLDVAPDRFVFRAYEGGHTVFEHEPSREALAADMRAFITETARTWNRAE